MNIFGNIFLFLKSEMTPPPSYGLFHIISVLAIVSGTVALCCLAHSCSERAVSRIALICWVVLVLFEIYRELVFSLNYIDGVFVWDYAWYNFPYQLCSTPMYVLPLVAFLKEGRLREMAISYISTFSLFGGLCVCIYPGDVFCNFAGINFQSMLHHGIQTMIGIFFSVRYRNSLGIKYFVSGIPVFAVLVSVAMVANVVVRHCLLAFGNASETFNMFFISPYYACTLPILSEIYKLVPYPVFLMIYFLGFVLAAFIVLSTVWGIVLLVRKNTEKKRSVNEQEAVS